MLDRLRQNVGGSSTLQTPAGFLRPIDTEKIARDLNIEAVAAEDGANEYPAPEDTAPSSMERSIVQRIEGEWTVQSTSLLNELRSYASRLSSYSVQAEAARLEVKASAALAELRTAEVRAGHGLQQALQSYKAFVVELARFREKHKLDRVPRVPTSRWTTLGLMFVLVAFEAVLNGFFFATGSEYGLLGGIGTAIGISITNVILAFLLGCFPGRWIHHRNWLLKLLGLLCLAGGIAVLVGLHAIAAHLREAAEANVVEKDQLHTAIHTLLSHPLSLNSLYSYYLFALGVLFAALAAWKGAAFDDPYPGYGAAARRADAARREYSERHQDIFDDLEDIRDDVIEALDAAIKNIPLYPQTSANIRAQRAALLQQFQTYETSLGSAANELLTMYRRSNRQSRKTNPPTHFDKPWQLRQSALTGSEVLKLTADVAEPEVPIGPVLTQLEALSRQVLREYERLMTNYPQSLES